ncbi:type III pantothenate kinase [Oceanihabitans sediminis]|uniref:Type III pantothenate kinase n=1 Tax=Oceanihabitans sediminis TaxID=1812012 RepID=A0A368P803_9FLAO|nr:type III pantothenate kinase [Oceanihabitans sediminis]MDX1278198.1 type III pantothenate kinase [Oceanihabitans sediminis]MDX1773941.1 type III pantothenate kinase [Oceanihabitans sediminis]RBP32033.1 type III pantothenate kinase [Oceanihabitans sediminis]RCU58688.1 type III pantothenate kinase [Oceanihabitans sediminis]
MNLIIDVGNSFVKLAVFQEDEIIFQSSVVENAFEKEFKNFLKKFSKVDKCIISSVGNLDEEALKLIKHSLKVVVLNAETKLPFKNLYATPKTLGVDRLALVSAAVQQFPKKDVLVIDAGTCVTYDFISAENKYLGGAISPGIQMRYSALNNLTAKLPLLKKEMPKNIIGNSTDSSIHSGVVFGVLNEIDGVLGSYKKKYPHLTVILTGGDANFLSKQLKNSIFANSNFLLQGLNFILQHNSNE